MCDDKGHVLFGNHQATCLRCLIEEIHRGNESAIVVFSDLLHPMLMRSLSRPRYLDYQHLYGDVSLKIIQCFKKSGFSFEQGRVDLSDEERLQAYVDVSISNAFRSEKRIEKRETNLQLRLSLGETGFIAEKPKHDIHEFFPDWEERLKSLLPRTQYAYVRLRINGLSLVEIAETYHETSSAIAASIYLARKKIEKAMFLPLGLKPFSEFHDELGDAYLQARQAFYRNRIEVFICLGMWYSTSGWIRTYMRSRLVIDDKLLALGYIPNKWLPSNVKNQLRLFELWHPEKILRTVPMYLYYIHHDDLLEFLQNKGIAYLMEEILAHKDGK